MKKGFTLIELLAVIVILAIIALIAVPIVLNIIKDTKESSMLRSADFYIDALEISIATKMLDGSSIQDGTYNIIDNGNICLEYDEKETCINILEVEVDGEVPTSGTITIISGKINDINLTYPSGTVTQNTEGKLVLGEVKEEKVTLANYIKNLYNPTTTATVNGIEYDLDATNLLMNDRLGNSEVDKLEGNIRYYGANPNNYIDIGDRDSEGNIIFWRIIGLFKNVEVTDENDNVIKTEDLVKIIRSDKLTSGDVNGFSWDYTSTGASDNNWNDSTLQIMLNDEVNGYYASGTSSYYNNSTTATELNFASTGLSSETHNKIARVKWSLGGHSTSSIYSDTMYGYERTGTNTWSGKIVLMYPSDYGYSADLSSCQTTLSSYDNSTCTTTNWMYDSNKWQWTLIPYSSYADTVCSVYPSGNVNYGNQSNVAIGVRPVLYLNSDVGIVEEKETSEGLKYFVVE